MAQTNSNQSHAFIGKGKIYMTAIKNGVKGKPFWVGVASAMAFSHTVEDEQELFESHTGNSVLWDIDEGTKKVSMSLTIQERRKEAMLAALQASSEAVTAGDVTDELHEANEIGDLIFTKHQNIDAVVIEDGTDPMAQPLADGVDYKVDAVYGRIELLKGGFVAPLKVSYSYGTREVIKPMTDSVDYYEVRVDGLNKVGQKDKQLVIAYRVKLNPADTYDLINESFAEMQIEGNCLFDDSKNASYEINKL